MTLRTKLLAPLQAVAGDRVRWGEVPGRHRPMPAHVPDALTHLGFPLQPWEKRFPS